MWLNLCPAVDGDPYGLVVVEPDVEAGESRHVGDLDLLADVDDLVLVGIGFREQERRECGVRLIVLEVHLAFKGIDICLDGSISLDGGVDLHVVGVALSLENVDALDLKMSRVHLALSNLGHNDEDATSRGRASVLMKHRRGHRGIVYSRQGDSHYDKADEEDNIYPPKPLAVSCDGLLLRLDTDAILGLVVLWLVRHGFDKRRLYLSVSEKGFRPRGIGSTDGKGQD